MKRRLFIGLLFSSLVGIFLSLVIVVAGSYQERLAEMKLQARTYADYLSQLSEEELQQNLLFPSSWDFRVTIVDSDGTVEFDSQTNASNMDNHGMREEVMQAQEVGQGETLRYSSTKDTDTYYYAVKLSNGKTLRISGELRTVWNMIKKLTPWVLLGFPPILLLLILFSSIQTRKIVGPINQIDLNTPLQNDTYEEISPLLRRMHQQNSDLENRMDEIRKQKQQLSLIMEQMQEGLIVLDKEGIVLSMNPSAAKLFMLKADESVGRNYLEYIRQPEVSDVVARAFSGIPSSSYMEKDDKYFHIYANPVMRSDKTDGILLLIWDETEQFQNEQMRREFTANVSHELKTPLTSISGYAELLSSGIAKGDDVNLFSKRIYTETKRLIQLVEDIMRVSQLDEQELTLEKSTINLWSLAQMVKELLSDFAEEKQLTFEISGDKDLTVFGVPSILEEMLRNLCDNAIKYNKDGGRVEVRICLEGSKAVLAVSDTGVGIAPEHQERIFERFFRVDKSHSRKSGGTGLGLSIVKHGVICHGGSYRLTSVPGSGTTITLELPLE